MAVWAQNREIKMKGKVEISAEEVLDSREAKAQAGCIHCQTN
jgi:hypothetical protein